MTTEKNLSRAGREDGFSLVEAIIAVLVFIIGIAAVSNLFIVAATANSTANTSSASATLASEVMDRLRAIPMTGAGKLTARSPAASSLSPSASDNCAEAVPFPTVAAPTNCVVPGNFTMRRLVPGVGDIHVNWNITDASAGAGTLFFITVRAQSTAAIVGERGYAEFTTLRSAN